MRHSLLSVLSLICVAGLAYSQESKSQEPKTKG